jgi:hypothetical protein
VQEYSFACAQVIVSEHQKADAYPNISYLLDNVDMRVSPSTKGCRTLNRDTLFTLKVHAVHLSTDTVLAFDVVNIFNTSSIKQNTLGQCSFAAVKVKGLALEKKDAIEHKSRPARRNHFDCSRGSGSAS